MNRHKNLTRSRNLLCTESKWSKTRFKLSVSMASYPAGQYHVECLTNLLSVSVKLQSVFFAITEYNVHYLSMCASGTFLLSSVYIRIAPCSVFNQTNALLYSFCSLSLFQSDKPLITKVLIYDFRLQRATRKLATSRFHSSQ